MLLVVVMVVVLKISPLGDVMVSDGDDRGAQVPPHRLKKHCYHIVIKYQADSIKAFFLHLLKEVGSAGAGGCVI